MVRFDKDSGYIKKRKKYLNGQISATWKPKWVDGLSFSGMVNYNDIDYFEKSWNATAKQYELDGSLYQSSVKPSMDVKSGYSRIFDMEFKAAIIRLSSILNTSIKGCIYFQTDIFKLCSYITS